jgi:hypothetical protein
MPQVRIKTIQTVMPSRSALEPGTFVRMPIALLLRMVCGVLFAATVIMCVALALHKQGAAALKLTWIAALLLLFAANPSRLPPFGVPIETLGFYRAAFGVITGILILASLFVIFFIQLPHERIPHYAGTVVSLVNGESGQTLPEVRYQTSDGETHTFIDQMAPVLYPTRRFAPAERVSVIVVKDHPRIDEPALVRWSTPVVVFVCTLFMAALTLISHRRYASLPR